MMLYVFYEYCYADGEWDIWVDDDWPLLLHSPEITSAMSAIGWC